MEEKLITKKDLLGKLRAYSNTPDDENILYRLGCQKPILIFDFACTLKI